MPIVYLDCIVVKIRQDKWVIDNQMGRYCIVNIKAYNLSIVYHKLNQSMKFSNIS